MNSEGETLGAVSDLMEVNKMIDIDVNLSLN